MSKGMRSTEVTWDDQVNINTFGKLNVRMHELQASIKAKERLKEDLEDASNELMLSDDDNVRFVVGECFLHMDKDAAEARLQAQSSAADTELAGFRKELEAVKAKMAQLKTVLYSKFGNTINLEDEPQ